MSTVIMEIEAYLATCGAPQEQAVDVAIVFARSMSRELRMSLDQWEEAAQTLETLKAARLRANEN